MLANWKNCTEEVVEPVLIVGNVCVGDISSMRLLLNNQGNLLNEEHPITFFQYFVSVCQAE